MRAACVLATYDAANPKWEDEPALATFVVDRLLVAVQAQIIAFSHDYQLVMVFILCSIPLAIMIGSTKAALRSQAGGGAAEQHAVME